jgi:hypothetical protein
MYVTHPHPHPRRALLAALAALALALALPALLPATLADLGANAGGGSPSQAAPATAAEPAPSWIASPFAWPLLQVPPQARSLAGGGG